MSMRSTIDIDDGRIFLGWVEIVRLDHAIVEICHTIGSLDDAILIDGLGIVFPGVLCSQQAQSLSCLDVGNINVTGYIRLSKSIIEPLATFRKGWMVRATSVV